MTTTFDPHLRFDRFLVGEAIREIVHGALRGLPDLTLFEDSAPLDTVSTSRGFGLEIGERMVDGIVVRWPGAVINEWGSTFLVYPHQTMTVAHAAAFDAVLARFGVGQERLIPGRTSATLHYVDLERLDNYQLPPARWNEVDTRVRGHQWENLRDQLWAAGADAYALLMLRQPLRPELARTDPLADFLARTLSPIRAEPAGRREYTRLSAIARQHFAALRAAVPGCYHWSVEPPPGATAESAERQLIFRTVTLDEKRALQAILAAIPLEAEVTADAELRPHAGGFYIGRPPDRAPALQVRPVAPVEDGPAHSEKVLAASGRQRYWNVIRSSPRPQARGLGALMRSGLAEASLLEHHTASLRLIAVVEANLPPPPQETALLGRALAGVMNDQEELLTWTRTAGRDHSLLQLARMVGVEVEARIVSCFDRSGRPSDRRRLEAFGPPAPPDPGVSALGS